MCWLQGSLSICLLGAPGSLWRDRAWLPTRSRQMSLIGVSAVASPLGQAISQATGHLSLPRWRARPLVCQAGSCLTGPTGLRWGASSSELPSVSPTPGMWLPTSQMCPHIRGRGPGSVTAPPCDLRQGPLSLGLSFSVCTKKGSGLGGVSSYPWRGIQSHTLSVAHQTQRSVHHTHKEMSPLLCVPWGFLGLFFPLFTQKQRGAKRPIHFPLRSVRSGLGSG